MNLLTTLALETETPVSQWKTCATPRVLKELDPQEFHGLQRTYLNEVDGRLALVRRHGRHVTVEFLPHLAGEAVDHDHHDSEAYKLIARELRHHLIQKDSKLEQLSLVGSLCGILTAGIVLFFTLPADKNGMNSFGPPNLDQLHESAGTLFWLAIVFALYIMYKKGKRLVGSRKLRAKKLHELTAEEIINRWENNLPEKKVVPEKLGTKPILKKTQIIILDILQQKLPRIHPCENPTPGGTRS